MTGKRLDRRTMLRTTGAALAGSLLAGCIGDSGGGGGNGGGGNGGNGGGGNGGGGNTVAAGPNGKLIFKPEKITVKKGDTVTWKFKSPAHNVCAWPEMHKKVSIPEGAKGFGTMKKGGDKYATVSKGETFEHTFQTTGEYTYVCVPHAGSGMVGTVVVEK